MMNLGGTRTMTGKLIVIFNTLQVALLVVFFVTDMKLCFLKRVARPKSAASDQQIIDFNKSKYKLYFIDIFSDP